MTTSKQTNQPAMFCLSRLSTTKTLAQASMPGGTSPSVQTNVPKPTAPTRKSINLRGNKKIQPRPPPPSLIQIERIIGTGSFRDGEPRDSDSDRRKSVFELFMKNKFEGPVEKKLRETGEWLVANTETEFRYAGKGILMFVFQWLLPIWAMSLLVASGVIKLPFSTPFLDDLLM